MKNRTAIVLLGVLLVVGIVVIYQNARADMFPCDWLQDICLYSCNGSWNIDQGCWEWQGSWYCSYVCQNFNPFHHCTWTDPETGICWWR